MGAGEANEEREQSDGKQSAKPGVNLYSLNSEKRKREDSIL